jgi:hypothetical protein
VVFWFSFDIKREQSALMKKRSAPRRRRAKKVTDFTIIQEVQGGPLCPIS